jgi:AAA15 family ATPase/GTPase
MLVRFTVENYLSFRDRVEFSMVAASDRPAADARERPRFEHVVRAAGAVGPDLLKVAVVYGPNASGKSNLVKAMEAAQRIILRPVEAGRAIPLAPFKLDKASLRKPTRFEFEIRLPSGCFAYGFAVSADRVHEEWLVRIDQTDDQVVFERKGAATTVSGIDFASAEEEQFLRFTAKGTLPNRLFLTECRERNVRKNVRGSQVLYDVLDWFENGLVIIFPESKYQGLLVGMYQSQQFKQDLARYLNCFDTGIEAIDLEEVDFDKLPVPAEVRRRLKGNTAKDEMLILAASDDSHWLVKRDGDERFHAWKLVTRHGGRNGASRVTFDMQEESDGTRRLLDLVPAMMTMLEGDRVFVIDELDRSLHADVSNSYIANFLRYSEGGRRQLIVTTHETTLLAADFLRPDEVWLVEKGQDQSSKLFALEEFKLKAGRDLQADYLQGRFGAVPVLRDFSWLRKDHAPGT